MQEYKIIQANIISIASLQREVNEAMEHGWLLYGNLVIDNGIAYQTLVRIRR